MAGALRIEAQKEDDSKITVVHCLLKHAESRRPASHRTPKISLAKSDARHEADAMRKRVAASSDMEAALADEASNARTAPRQRMGRGSSPSSAATSSALLRRRPSGWPSGERAPVETAAGFAACCAPDGSIVVPRDACARPSSGGPAAYARSSVRGARKKACCSRQQRLPKSSPHHEACTIHELRDRPAPGADDGAATAPRGACWRGCRRGQPHRAAGAGQKTSLPAWHEFRRAGRRPGLHHRHPRARPSKSHRSPTYSRFDPRRSTTRRASRRGTRSSRASGATCCPSTPRSARSSTSSSSSRGRRRPARTPSSRAWSSRRAA